MRRRPGFHRTTLAGLVLATAWAGALVAKSHGGEGLAAAVPGADTGALQQSRNAGTQTAGARGSARQIRRPVDWVALNPEFDGATFVNDRATCLDCHEDSMRSYDHSLHAAALTFAPGADKGGDCETCHGPRSEHNEDPTDVLAYERLSPAGQSAVCMQCHEGGTRMGWKAGAHHNGDVSCTSCHVVMEKRSERGLLARQSPTRLCYDCHAEVRAEALKPSHHPIREGQMDCSSCHNPHGSTEGMLVRNTVAETCATCHTGKRGPFLWEHPPVRENCATCHTPHGSNNRFLLTQREPFLCLTCHSYGGHINLPRYNRTSNIYGNGCTNCHITTHGSNHPSGAKQTR
jgi:DmsE family decaheme c-type cytochrome